jgi:hypothetical protein
MSEHIDDLDASLAENGEDVVLRRITAGVTKDVTVRAHVRTYRLSAQDLVNGISWIPFVVIISPTQIRAAGWPAGEVAAAAPYDADPSIPRIGDMLIIKGDLKYIKSSNPIAVTGEVVKIQMMTEG